MTPLPNVVGPGEDSIHAQISQGFIASASIDGNLWRQASVGHGASMVVGESH
jgi:hypothetical protein